MAARTRRSRLSAWACSCQSCEMMAARPTTSKVVLTGSRKSTQSTAETNVDSWSWLSGSQPTSALGLGALCISSHKESNRELPSSATESDSNPVPSSQPAFPVQSLPYLCLGRAKNSTSLDVLST